MFDMKILQINYCEIVKNQMQNPPRVRHVIRTGQGPHIFTYRFFCSKSIKQSIFFKKKKKKKKGRAFILAIRILTTNDTCKKMSV